jgi:MFS family permease
MNLGPARQVGCVFLPFAAGYFLSYLFRTLNGPLAGQLTHDLGLNASGLGLLTSVYFLTFAGAQLPLGAALDRFGPRRTQIALLWLAAAGAALFAIAPNVPLLILARALIGLGVSGALMAGLKAIVIWMPKKNRPVLNGVHHVRGAWRDNVHEAARFPSRNSGMA